MGGLRLGRSRRSSRLSAPAFGDEPTRLVDLEARSRAMLRLESAIVTVVKNPATAGAEDEAPTTPLPRRPVSDVCEASLGETVPLRPVPLGPPSDALPVSKPPLSRPGGATVVTVKTGRGRSGWVLFACGLLAGAFAGLAVIASPLGDPPTVKREVVAARDGAVVLAARARVAVTDRRGP